MIQAITKKIKKAYKRYKYEKELLCKKAKNTKVWIIKIIPHGKDFAISYRLTLKHIFMAIAIFALVFASFFIWSQRTSIHLATANKKLESQNKQISELLEKQNKEIIKQLEEVKKKDNEVRKIVGLKPKKQDKISIKGSRRGIDETTLAQKIRELQKEVQQTKKDQEQLKAQAVKYRTNVEKVKIIKKLASIPSRWPVDGYISSGFGWRTHPLYGGSHFHTGLDIIAEYGSPIHATASGVVIEAGYDGGYGYTVKIDHGSGYETLYAHCSSMVVSVGQSISKGQVISYVGSSGTATGSHVHYEVKHGGERIDPQSCLNTETVAYKSIAMKLKKIK